MFESHWIFRVSQLLIILVIRCSTISTTDCENCRTLSQKFILAAVGSPSKGFVGGNTLWEERNFGSYATSEIRFHEILENICSKDDSDCNDILERLEHPLEKWWEKVFKRNQSKIYQLAEDMCVSDIQLCCPINKFGPNCLDCSPCSLIGGWCDGNGTRSGSGSCICSSGYKGISCDECDLKTHFKENAACHPCHQSCSGGCNGPNSTDCNGCAPGWTQVSTLGTLNCEDIDECLDRPCQRSEYCVNSPGSYSCEKCSAACDGCVGPHSDQCLQCNSGYHLIDGSCVDIDECSATPAPCKRGEVCENLVGSFACVCGPGYIKRDGICQPAKQGTSIRSNKPEKIIWTVSFAKEFLKYVVALLAFFVTHRIFKGNAYVTAFSVSALGLFLYFQSGRFDFVFSKQS